MAEYLKPSEYYEKGLSDRKPYEDRAEEFAEITIPALFRKEGESGSDALKDRYVQSLGAKLVNNLVAKIGITLFPPSSSGFKLSPKAEDLLELTQGNPDMLSEINRIISMSSESINRAIEIQEIRRDVFGLVEQLIVVGSAIMEKVPDNGIKIHGLRSFVVTLDDNGEAWKMCIVETLTQLPKELIGFMEEDKDEYELYTMATLDRATDKWTVIQEVGGEIVGKEKVYNKKKFPFEYQGMRWSIGEKYHRPFVEDSYGSINSYDKLSRVLTEGALIASKSLIFVDERGGRTRKRDVATSVNGAVIDVRADDVTSFQHNKNFDFQVPMQVREELKRELSETFLAMSSITRQAERVTAEEISRMGQELETALSGVYARMSSKISRRVITWVMNELKIDLKAMSVDIITGLNALGLSNEIMKLDGFMTRLGQLQMTNWVEQKELVDRYAIGYGVNTVNLVKTPQQVQQELQEQQAQMAQQQLVQSGADSLGKSAGQALMGGQA